MKIVALLSAGFLSCLLAACGASGESGTSTEPRTTPATATASDAPPSATTPATPPAETTPPGPPSPETPNPYAGGAPIAAPAGQWSYVPMADFVCGNGNASGIAVNPSSAPNAPLLVFFMGGGACWDALTCLGGAASFIDSDVGSAEVLGDVPRVRALFDREAAQNPFKDASFVFIPYCTGDLHGGDAQKTYSLLTKTVTVHHRGARNTDAVVKRLLATYASPSKIYVTGASGGGYGAMFGLHRFRTAWPTSRIDILNDCGPPIDPAGNTWTSMREAWKLEIPAACTGCEDDAAKVLPYLSATMGDGRFALLGYTKDKTIRSFSGRLVPQDFEQEMMALRAAAGPKQRMYYVDSDDHVLLKQNPLPVASSGVPLYAWLQRFASDDPAWAHEGP